MPDAKKCTGCEKYFDPPFHGWFILGQILTKVTPKVMRANPQVKQAVQMGLIDDDMMGEDPPEVNGEFHDLECLVNYVNTNYDLLLEEQMRVAEAVRPAVLEEAHKEGMPVVPPPPLTDEQMLLMTASEVAEYNAHRGHMLAEEAEARIRRAHEAQARMHEAAERAPVVINFENEPPEGTP